MGLLYKGTPYLQISLFLPRAQKTTPNVCILYTALRPAASNYDMYDCLRDVQTLR